MVRESIKGRKSIKNISTEIIDIVNRYIEIVSKNYDVIAIILFGSYAKGTQREDSDIDIAIVTDDIKTDKFDEEVNLMQLRNNIDYRIEPHIISGSDYKNDETPFVLEVKNTGIKVA